MTRRTNFIHKRPIFEEEFPLLSLLVEHLKVLISRAPCQVLALESARSSGPSMLKSFFLSHAEGGRAARY